MLELARGERGLLQDRNGRGRPPPGRQGQPQFQVDPGFRPVVGLSGAALQDGDDVVEQRIVGGQRSEQLAAAADGQRRAANDLLRLDGKQVGRLHDPALLERCEASITALPQRHRVRQLAQRGLQPADLPGGRLLPAGVGADRLQDDLRQPRGKGLVDFQGVRVMGQGLGVWPIW